MNRRTRTTFADTHSSATAYDSLGRRIAETDQAGKSTTFGYDAVGRLTRVTDALNKSTTYGYDEVGNRIRQTDANGRITRFEYDALGRETKRTLPGGGAFETKGYDVAGNLASRTDFMGRTIVHGYDIADRLTSMTYPGSSTVGFTYTPTGRRLTATDARGTTGYGYDLRDRLTSLTYPDGRRLGYAYDAASNRTSLTATVGASTLTTGFAYDDANRLSTVTDALGRTYGHGYDPNGNRTALSHPNFTNTAYVYDPVNRLTSLTTTGPVGIVQGYAFTLGPTGNRTQIDETDGHVRTYAYDAVYRLTSETVAGLLNYGKTWTYDDVGNRLTQLTTGLGAGSVNYAYDDRDRLVTEAGAALGYDDNGNLTSKSADGSVYTWDFENRLTGVSKPDGTLVTHVYDVDGARVQTTTTLPGQPPATVDFLVDTSGSLSHVVAESDPVAGLQAYYVRGDDLLAVMRGTGTRFMHADGHGSIRRLTSESGAVTDVYTYTAFGELLSHMGTDPQPYSFAGEPLDPNVGFQYHRARWMDPSVGRFAGMDPFGGFVSDPASLHKYVYAHGNPVGNTDPTGHFASVGEISIVNSIISQIAGNQVQLGMDVVLDTLFKDNAAVQVGRVLVSATGAVVGLSALALKLSRSGFFRSFLARYKICSFSADTPVWTDDGETSIAEIAVGDLVWGYDEASGTTGLHRVTAVMAHEDPVIVLLTVGGEELTTTPEHPFFMSDGQWVPAGDLKVGDQVRRADGSVGAVERIATEERVQAMYNLTVDQAHTFFVGRSRWLVHNTCALNWGRPDSQLLKTRLLRQGTTEPPYPHAAHHIVAGSANRAKPAKEHLELLGFDANDPANGVLLRTSDLGTGANHRSLHSHTYYDAVNDLITQTRTKEEAIEVLKHIAGELLQDTFPH
jgi:RHS repeat-associated protein